MNLLHTINPDNLNSKVLWTRSFRALTGSHVNLLCAPIFIENEFKGFTVYSVHIKSFSDSIKDINNSEIMLSMAFSAPPVIMLNSNVIVNANKP